MSTQSKSARLAFAAVCGLLAVGAAACTGGSHNKGAASPRPAANGVPAAARATKAKAANAPATMPMNSVSNLTPYTWTLASTQVQGGPQPPQTVLPGQTASWNGTPPPSVDYGGGDSGPGSWVTDYRFTDLDGIKHQVKINRFTPGYIPNSYFAYSEDDLGAGWFDSTSSFQMENTDGNGPHTDAVWKSPTTVTIDGATDPASAAAAVTYELPRAIPATEKWTPNPGTKPTFAWGPTSRATSMLYNYSSQPATVVKGHDTTKGQSTSLGEEVTASASVNVYGVAAKAAVSFTSDQEWGSSDSVGVDVDTEVEPGYAGWINKRADVASLTGHLVFTTPEQITFDISNVTISKGDIVNTGAGGAPTGMDFTPDDCLITDCPPAAAGSSGVSRAAKAAAVPAVNKGAALSASPGQLVVIDASIDQADAVEALKNYENATDRSFTPTADPTFAHSSWVPVTDQDGNPAPSVTGNSKTGQSVTERLNISHQESSSWSLGGSIETSVGFDLAGIVDEELSTKFTANHTWESDTTDSQGIWVTAEPGKTVWIEASTSTASYTGNFAFTAGGVRYLVNNVTITQPASPDVDAMSNTAYRVMEVNASTAGQPTGTTGGIKAISTLPKLQTYINHGH